MPRMCSPCQTQAAEFNGRARYLEDLKYPHFEIPGEPRIFFRA
jgi:hypothetical protein